MTTRTLAIRPLFLSPPRSDLSPTAGALIPLAMSALLASMGTSIANVALPTFATDFAAPFDHVQWIVLIYLLAITTTIVTAGRLGDLFGRRRMLLVGIAVFSAASFLCGMAPSLMVLLAGRALQGIGAALMTALSLALVAETVSSERTGSAIGLLGTMSAVGTALGPSLGGVLLATLGWRSIFFVSVPISLVSFAFAYRRLTPDGRTENNSATRLDLAGTVLLALALATYALGLTSGRGPGVPRLLVLVGSLIAFVLFLAWQRRAAAPLIRLEILRSPRLVKLLTMNGLATSVVMATLIAGPFHLSRTLHLSLAEVGLVMACGPLVAALTGVPAGILVDRFGTGTMTSIGLIAMASGAAALSVVPVAFAVPGYLIPLAFLTAGYALFQAANNTAAMQRLESGQRGVVSGLLNLSRNLGLITGASVMGALYAAGSSLAEPGNHIMEADPGLSLTFGIGTVLVLIALTIRETTSLELPAER